MPPNADLRALKQFVPNDDKIEISTSLIHSFFSTDMKEDEKNNTIRLLKLLIDHHNIVSLSLNFLAQNQDCDLSQFLKGITELNLTKPLDNSVKLQLIHDILTNKHGLLEKFISSSSPPDFNDALMEDTVENILSNSIQNLFSQPIITNHLYAFKAITLSNTTLFDRVLFKLNEQAQAPIYQNVIKNNSSNY